MRFRLASALVPLLALAPVPILAQEASDAAAIEATVRDQLADFNGRDVAGAWEHASPLIQGMFGSPEAFGTMVQAGYPMVWTSEAAEFMPVEDVGGVPHQKVMVRDAEGAGWIVDYEMVEVEGRWLINGVMVLPAPELAA